jgi:hypothetical protein
MNETEEEELREMLDAKFESRRLRRICHRKNLNTNTDAYIGPTGCCSMNAAINILCSSTVQFVNRLMFQLHRQALTLHS